MPVEGRRSKSLAQARTHQFRFRVDPAELALEATRTTLNLSASLSFSMETASTHEDSVLPPIDGNKRKVVANPMLTLSFSSTSASTTCTTTTTASDVSQSALPTTIFMAPSLVTDSTSETSVPGGINGVRRGHPSSDSLSSIGSDGEVAAIVAESCSYESDTDSGHIPLSALNILDPHHPREVNKHVNAVLSQWSSSAIAAVHPDKFLSRILRLRGYNTEMTSSVLKTPSEKQIGDYDQDILQAIRGCNIERLKTLHSQGKSMTACNKYSESIVHMACRRADFETVEFLLDFGGDISVVDDYGRTPLHDACWRPEPRFDIITLLLDRNLGLLLTTDIRGSSPLSYVRQEHWLMWCAYLYYMKDKYWVERPAVGLIRSTSMQALQRAVSSESLNESDTKRARPDER